MPHQTDRKVAFVVLQHAHCLSDHPGQGNVREIVVLPPAPDVAVRSWEPHLFEYLAPPACFVRLDSQDRLETASLLVQGEGLEAVLDVLAEVSA